ncbi:MAG: ribose-5-phosphate isomerase RpiA [Burkholderiales bacterium]|nr:ribose-5-phosphate isomerase RpiA [Burkholderiales bacterium]
MTTAATPSASAKEAQKLAAAQAALNYVVPGAVLGVGSGSTVALFASLLGDFKHQIPGAVAASEATARVLRAVGVPLLDLNAVSDIPVYVDGADEIDAGFSMIKGGGAALTREKIVAEASTRFVCIVDASKHVAKLGNFPLPIEVIPMAAALVSRRLQVLGGVVTQRAGVITDNGNLILDVRGLDISDPARLESQLNQLPGVVTNGIFARRGADVCITASAAGITTTQRPAA